MTFWYNFLNFRKEWPLGLIFMSIKHSPKRILAGTAAAVIAATSVAVPRPTMAAEESFTETVITVNKQTPSAAIAENSVSHYSYVKALSEANWQESGPFTESMAANALYDQNRSYDIPWIVSNFPNSQYTPYPAEYMYYKTDDGNMLYCIDFNKAPPTYGDKSYSLSKSTTGFSKNSSVPSDSTMMLSPLLYGSPCMNANYYGITEAQLSWATSMGFKFISGKAYDAASDASSDRGLYWPDFIDDSHESGLDKIIQKFNPSTDLTGAQYKMLAEMLSADVTGEREFSGDVSYNTGITGYTGDTQNAGEVMGAVLDIMQGASDIKADSGNFERNMVLSTSDTIKETDINDVTLKGPYRLNISQGELYSSKNAGADGSAFTDEMLYDNILVSIADAPTGTTVTNSSGTAFAKDGSKYIIPANTDFYIAMPIASAVNKSFSVSADSQNIKTVNNVYYSGTTAADNQTQRMVPGIGYTVSGKFDVAFAQREGEIKIKKVDSVTDKVLSGAVFGVYTDNTCATTPVGTIETDENGSSSLKVPYGTYYLKEITAPENYFLSGEITPVVVNGKAEAEIITLGNEPYGSLAVVKADKFSSAKLQNAKFSLTSQKDVTYKGNVYKAGTAIGGEKTTDANGTASWPELPYGEYILTETESPTGYQIADYTKGITIAANSPKIEENVVNIPLGEIEIEKVDSDNTDKHLRDAVFSVKTLSAITYKTKQYTAGSVIDTLTTDANGKAVIKDLPIGKYIIAETKSPEGYIQNATPIEIEISGDSADSISRKITIKNEKEVFGQIVINKTDGNDTKLKDAQFTIYDADKNIVETITTDENGVAKSSFLELGVYYVKETKAPYGYEIDTTEHKIELTKDKAVDALVTETLDVTNVVMTWDEENSFIVRVIKKDKDTEKPLAGAEFEIYDSNKQLLMTLVTGEDGIAESGFIPYREGEKYELKETKAPNGYLISKTNSMVFTADDAMKNVPQAVVEYEITNEMAKGKISVTKTDRKTKSALEGAIFGIYDKNNEEICRITTGNNGIGTSEDIPLGEYTIKEIKAPEGYVLDDTTNNISITENGEVVKFAMDNEKSVTPMGQITIIKTDSETNKGLSGAEFVIRNTDGSVVDTVTTDQDGRAYSKQLVYGEYAVEETKAPILYELTTKIYRTNIDENNPDSTLNIPNTKLSGDLRLFKIDDTTHVPLAGAIFRLQDSEGNMVATLTTDFKGEAYIDNLDIGQTYTVEEIAAPDGYVKSNEVYKIKFDVSQAIPIISSEITIPNRKMEIVGKGRIELLKTDISGNALKGAEFLITDEEGLTVGTVITGSDGIGRSKELDNGTYTVRETKAPVGYILDNTAYKVVINGDGQVLDIKTLTITNQKQPEQEVLHGFIQIIKKDSITDARIPGTIFNIYANEDIYEGKKLAFKKGDIADVLKTDKTGTAISKGLPLGKYYAREKQASDGYIISDEKMYFTLTENNYHELQTETAYNTPTEVVIAKTDLTTSAPVPGAVIEIYDDNGDVVFKDTTDRNGKIKAFALPEGEYTFREIIAPDGYILNKSEFEFSIDKDGDVHGDTSITNRPTEVVITKTDLTTAQPLSGAQIEIRDIFGRVVFSDVTSANGQIKAFYLPFGTYTFTETAAPDGYIKSSETFVFEIKQDGTIVGDCTITNKPTEVVITKKDITSAAPLPGATISIKNASGKEVFRDVTDKNGNVKAMKLKPGKYTFYEISAPDGYSVNTETFHFELKPDGSIAGDCVIYDTPTKVVITKKDAVTKQTLSGAKIQIADKNGRVVFSGKTDEAGQIVVEGLNPGKYSYEETIAPDGYVLDSRKHYFTVMDDGIVAGDTTIYNQPKEMIKTGVETPNNPPVIPAIAAIVAFAVILHSIRHLSRKSREF